MSLSKEQTEQWQEQGFLYLPEFYSEIEIDRINAIIEQLWKQRKKLGPEYVIDIFVESDKEKRVYFCDAPNDARNAPYKLNDLFLSSKDIRKAVAGEQLAPILAELLEGLPMICNSLNFEFGSQQDYHFDTFYMPSPTPNKMIASWLALEDATPVNGPLSYYPGSHKIPPYHFSNGSTIIIESEMPEFRKYMAEQIEQRGLQATTLEANKGDLLIWHSQLFHGGSPILDKSKTRKSLVTHYFTKEDFPDHPAPMVTDQSCFMQRPAQPTGYPYSQPKNFWQKLFG